MVLTSPPPSHLSTQPRRGESIEDEEEKNREVVQTAAQAPAGEWAGAVRSYFSYLAVKSTAFQESGRRLDTACDVCRRDVAASDVWPRCLLLNVYACVNGWK